MAERQDQVERPEMDAVAASVERERTMSAAMRRRQKPVRSGEANPGGGEYLEELPPGPAGTGSQVGDGRDDAMTKILVPIDGSELAAAAMPVAGWLARGLHASVVLVTVGKDPETSAQAADQLAALERSLTKVSAELLGVFVRRRIEIANAPAEGIIAAAREEHPDLIVMSTHGRAGWSQLVEGSVAEQVVRANVAPVTLIRPSEQG